MAIDYFRNAYGIPASRLLPYPALVIPFAYFFHHHRQNPSGNRAKYLEDFFWRVSLSGRYSQSVESRSMQDVQRMDDILGNKPQTHKTKHHGRQRLIFIGPRGQEILRPYLATTKDDEYIFRPESAEKVRNELRRAARKSPMTPSQAKRKPKEAPKRTPGKRYQRVSYTRAITRACKLAKVSEWSPNQLRHNAATELRKVHGLEGTRTVLGHSSTDMTQVYAEIDFDAARKIMLASG